MEEWLAIITRHAVVVIEAMALVMIAYGTAEAFLKGLRAMFSLSARARSFGRSGCAMRAGWLPA